MSFPGKTSARFPWFSEKHYEIKKERHLYTCEGLYGYTSRSASTLYATLYMESMRYLLPTFLHFLPYTTLQLASFILFFHGSLGNGYIIFLKVHIKKPWFVLSTDVKLFAEVPLAFENNPLHVASIFTLSSWLVSAEELHISKCASYPPIELEIRQPATNPSKYYKIMRWASLLKYKLINYLIARTITKN